MEAGREGEKRGTHTALAGGQDPGRLGGQAGAPLSGTRGGPFVPQEAVSHPGPAFSWNVHNEILAFKAFIL